MKKILSFGKIVSLICLFVLTGMQVLAVKYNYPSGLNAITGGGTVCENASVILSLDITTATCGTGGPGTDISISVSWYSNTINSTVGGTLVSGPTASTTGTTTFNYSPATATAGTLYYYCVISWSDPDGASACTAGSLTSSTASVIVNAIPGAVTVTGGGSFCANTTLNASGGAGGTIYWQNTTTNGTSTATASSSQLVSASGTYYFRAYSGGCWGTQGSAVVVISGALGTPVFGSGASSSRCKGAGAVTYSATAANSSSISYALDATSLAAGNTINSATGEVTYTAGWSGAAIITATASGCGSPTVANHTATTAGGSGTFSVGPTGNYASLTAALSAISACTILGAYILELQPAYVSTVETFPINITNYTGLSASNTITIRPASGASNLTISGTNATTLINLSGTNYIIIDGRAGGSGSTKDLTISNTNTSGSAIQFINDARYNTLQYCNIQGVSTSSTTGAVEFSTSATTGGNSNNTISQCNISGGASNVRNAVYSAGTATSGRYNMNNSISNCNIYNFFYGSGESNGIYMGAGTTDWTVQGCSFYQTASRTSSGSNRNTCIYVDNKVSGSNFQFLNNFIGGNAASCGGSAMTLTDGAFSGFKIKANPASGYPTIIDGNTIGNISLSTSSTSVNPLIYHIDGAVTINNNTIGSQSITNSILFSSPTAFTAPSTGPTMSGIMAGGALVSGSAEATIGGAAIITNNTIGGFSLSATGSGAPEFRGIDFGQVHCTFTITGNIIGSTTTANSISNSAPQAIFGIVGFADKAGVTQTVSNNTVANLTCTHTGSASEQRVVGIQAQGSAAGGVYLVSDNSVYNLSSAASGTARSVTAGIRAVNNSVSSDGTIVSGNLVYNLTNTNTGALSNQVLGIEFLGPATANNKVFNNRVYQVSLSSTGGSGRIYGIYASNGTALVYNNSVSLGFDNSGASITNPYVICGIAEASAATGNSFYFNTLSVGGTGVTGAANSYGFYSSITASKTIKNNIIYNSRSNGSGTGKHYGYGLPASGSTSDNNTIAASGTGGVFAVMGTTEYANLTAWIAGTSQDSNSEQQNPVFVSNTNLKLQAIEANGIINNSGIPIAGITSDYDAESRNTLMPDPGFDEIKIDGSWIGPTSTDWLTNSNWETSVIPGGSMSVWIRKASYFPYLTSATGIQAVKNLYLKGNTAALTLDGGGLQVAGTISNYGGTLCATNGSIELNGTAALQNISGSAFVNRTIKDLTLSNTNGVNISSTSQDTLKIAGILKFGNVNNTTLNTGNNLVLLSSATATAAVADLTNTGANSGNAITGTAIVERYISAARKWRFLSVPTNTTQTVKQAWQENIAAGVTGVSGYGMHITDNNTATWAANGFDFRSVAGPSVKTFNTSTLAWDAIPNTSMNIATNSGYMCYVRGDRNATPANATLTSTVLRTTGSLFQNDQPAITVPVGEFVPVGNPYAASVDVRNLEKTNVQDFFYLWDPMLGGSYGLGAYQLLSKTGADYVVTPGGGSYGATGSVTNFIQSGSAFFVRGTGTAGSLVFKEAAKNTSSSMVYRGNNQAEWLRANLVIPAANSETVADGVLVDFNDRYSNTVDFDDALKYANGSENVSLKRDDKLLGIERRHTAVHEDTLYLNLTGVRVQNYRWKLILNNMNVRGRQAFMVDNYLSNTIALDCNGTNNIDFSIENIPGSYAANRFMIVFMQLDVVPVTITNISAVKQPNNTNLVTWNVEHEVNIEKYIVEHSQDGRAFKSFGSRPAMATNGGRSSYSLEDDQPFIGDNFYRVKATGVDGQIHYSAIVKLNGVKTAPSVNIFPNPVTDHTMNLQFTAQPAGIYQLQLTNSIGQVIYNSSLKLNADNSTHAIVLPNHIAPGSYQLMIQSDKTQAIQVLVR